MTNEANNVFNPGHHPTSAGDYDVLSQSAQELGLRVQTFLGAYANAQLDAARVSVHLALLRLSLSDFSSKLDLTKIDSDETV